MGENHTIFNILATVVFCFPCAWPTRARICVQFPKRSAGGGGGGATERDAVRERFNISNVFHQRLASAPSRGPASQMSCLPPARPDAPPAASEAPASPGRSAARTSQVGGSRKKPPRAQHGGGDEGADGGGGWWSTRYHPTPPETQELEMVQKHEKD